MDKPIFKMVRKRMVSTRLQGWRNNYVGQTYSAGLPWSSGLGRREGSWRRSCSHLLLPCPQWIGGPPRAAPRTHLVVQQASGVSESLGAGGASVGPLAGVGAQVVSQVEAVLKALATARARVGLERGVPSEVAPQVRAVPEALATFAAVKGHPGSRGRRGWPWGSKRGRNPRQRGLVHGGGSRGGWGRSLEYRGGTEAGQGHLCTGRSLP